MSPARTVCIFLLLGLWGAALLTPGRIGAVTVALPMLRSSSTCEASVSQIVRRDTLVPSDIVYQGYRVHVRRVELLKQRKDRYLLRVEVVNTGKRAVGFGPGFPARFLQTDFDISLAQAGLFSLAGPLRDALLATDLKLEAGQAIAGQEFWVTPGEVTKVVEGRMDTFSRQAGMITRSRPTASTSDLVTIPTCPDLSVSKVSISQRGKSSVTLQISLSNVGHSAIDKNRAGTGATLDIYVGGSDRITNASKRIQRFNLSEKLSALNVGKGLGPGDIITLVEMIDITGVSKYNGVLTVQVDPGQVIIECDETNNTASLPLFE